LLPFCYLFQVCYWWRAATVLVNDRSVAKADVLARVKQDLALGRTYLATQRLRTLIVIDSGDLELREMLATVYRQTGNLAEAGRWGFLGTEVAAAELAAFARANPDPWLRLRMLRWSGDETILPADVQGRLRQLVTAAKRSGPPSAYRGPLSPARRRRRFVRGSAVPCLFVLVALVGIGSLAAIGLIRALNWVLG
jgi:hypothetical protein